MPASPYEQEWAQTHGVTIRDWPRCPSRSTGPTAHVSGVDVRAHARASGGRLEATGERIDARRRHGAEGDRPDARASAARRQRPGASTAAASRSTARAAPRSRRLGRRRLRRRRQDLTVEAVEDGKLAARSIDRGAADPLRCTESTQEREPWPISAPPSPASRSPEPVLARLRAADRQGLQRRPRLRGGLGRRRLEDARRRPADRQRQRSALRRAPRQRPPRHRLQQHRADHRPAARDQPAARSRRSSATGRTAPSSSR